MAVKKPRRPQWRRKGESLEAFQRRQHKYVDRLIAYKEHIAKEIKKAKKKK